MAKFIKGMQLSEMFFNEVVKQIIDTNFSDLKYSAGLIGSGSEVLGFDTERSTDHNWGPRVMIFVEEKDFTKKDKISKVFSKQLPAIFRGYSTHFGNPNEEGNQVLSKIKKGQLINHRVEIFTIKSFFEDYLKVDPNNDLNIFDWLTFSEQKLRTIQSGKIFYDQIELTNLKSKFEYYPEDMWFFLLASEWTKIGQEEAFVGRCGDVNDELGSKIIATRLVQSIMRLCFLMEKEYAPYSKWFGTAFAKLKSAKKLIPIFHKIISSENWQKREKYLSKAYEVVASMHNELKITKQLPTKVTEFHDRPYLVIHGDVFAEKIKKQIKNKDILHIKLNIGSVNQITNTVDLLEDSELSQRMKNLYE